MMLSAFLLIVFSPLLLLIAILVKADSKGPVIFTQKRVGRNSRIFLIYKFRTMQLEQGDGSSLLTIGDRDRRITKTGYWLRKYKLDELPQLLNVLLGHMSFVGPRPEVEKYVAHYTSEQRELLKVRPGITDFASIVFAEENELLAQSDEPEKFYLESVMPRKLKFNLEYLNRRSMFKDIVILFRTLKRIIKIR